MTTFSRPPYYALLHILIGFVGAFYPAVLILALIYQFSQYFLNIRIFAFEMRVESSNSFEHTIVKIWEILLGFLLGSVSRSFSQRAEHT